MNRPVTLFSSFLLLFFFIFSAHAQSEQPAATEPNYDVSLQLLVGSNDAANKSEVPSGLSAILRQLKPNFAFNDYRVSNTLIGRIASGGSFDYKSVAGISGREADPDAQSFLEWSLTSLSTAGSGVQSRGFRIGARVPVRTGSDSGGRPVYNYEAIGLNLNRIGLALNKPTLVGTLSLPRTEGTIFVVMTVRPAEL
jgi:hypothetical protein